MMIQALNKKGYSAYSISVPSPSELLQIFNLAAPVFVTMVSKVRYISLYSPDVPVHVIVSMHSLTFSTFFIQVAFYSLIIYFATSMGTQTVAAHQVSFTLTMPPPSSYFLFSFKFL